MGRITALALILGVVYGVRSISAGGMGCPMGNGGCCVLSAGHDEHIEAPAADTPVDPDAPKNIPAPVK